MKEGLVCMIDKFLFIGIYEGDVNIVKLVSTLEKAREIMKEAVINAMHGDDESVFDEYRIDCDFAWEADRDDAWVSIGKEYSWRIVPGKEVIVA